jgi:hypothetical protein
VSSHYYTLRPTIKAKMSGQNESAAWPKAEDPGLVQELLDAVQQASHYRQLKKGAVSCTGSLMIGITRATADNDFRTKRPSRMSAFR